MADLWRDGPWAQSVRQGRSVVPATGDEPQLRGPWGTREAEPEEPPVITEEVEPRRASEPAVVPRHMPRAGLPAEVVLSARVQAWLRTPDALRAALVVKEILDRPVALRRGRFR